MSPQYEYWCRDCNYQWIEQKKLEQCYEVSRCIKCQSNNTQKIISLTAQPQFKGSGWYETDYKPKKD